MNIAANADMKDFWNGVGALKWIHFQYALEASLAPFGRGIIEASGVEVGDLVLDIGCGCGDTTFEIGQRVGRDGHVHGLDISRPMILRSRKTKSKLGVKNVTFGCEDAQTYAFEPDLVDVVFSRFGVMFFDDPLAAFVNMRRGLKPGGRLAFLCWQSAQDNEWIHRSLDVVSRHIPLQEPLGPEQPGPLSFRQKARIERILTDAGFRDIQIEPSESSFLVGKSIDAAIGFLTQLGPAANVISQAEPDEITKALIVDDLRNCLMDYVTDKGVVMGAATWIVTAKNP